MNGRIRISSVAPEPSAAIILHRLEQELLKLNPASIMRKDSCVEVRGGIFARHDISRWNLLNAITLARVHVLPQSDHVLLTYDVQVTQLVWLCAASSALFLAFSMLAGGSWFIIIGAQLANWIWLFGVNYGLLRFRFGRFLRTVSKLDT